MKKIVIFDADGLVIKKPAIRFSERYAKEFKVAVPMSKIKSFFETEFQLCLEGKADLKKVLLPRLSKWGWPKSLDELIEYWFSGDTELDVRFKEIVSKLRGKGERCYLVTNNEKYRTDYLLKKHKLADLFDGVFSSSDVGALKSKKAFWEAVHQKIGSPEKSNVAVWDDDEKNVSAAAAFGYDAQFYSDFAKLEEWLKQSGAELPPSTF